MVKHSPIQINALTENIRLMLSSYTQAIQRQESMVGNLFQQKTKAKWVGDEDLNYAQTAFHYIPRNPYQAGLVRNLKDWEFSSLREYLASEPETTVGSIPNLCNTELACRLLGLDRETILKEAHCHISDEIMAKIL
jgi:putative transposase